MSLSCYCDFDGDYWYETAEVGAPLNTKRGRKCCSCGARLSVGDECFELMIFRSPKEGYEENRYPDGVPLASNYRCPKCDELAGALRAAGYCIPIGDNVNALLREYWEITGFDPEKYKGAA